MQEGPVYVVLNSCNRELKWDGKAISGFQSLENNTRVYLYLKPEQTTESVSVLNANGLKFGKEASVEDACLVLKFRKETKTVRLCYGISFIDVDQARKNRIK